MNLKQYQQKAMTTLTADHDYGDIDSTLMAQVLGLVGESGEVADKIKKIIRDDKGQLNDQVKLEIVKELGDVLWYVAATAELLGSSLDEVAELNIKKLSSRYKRGQIKGSGDNR